MGGNLCDYETTAMANDGKMSLAFTRLNDDNYAAWSFKMEMYLFKEDCWDPIVHVGEMEAAMKKKNRKALSLIVLCVDDGQHVHLRSSKGGREAWANLKEFHVQSTMSSRIRILKRLFRIQLQEGGSMLEHLHVMTEGFHELNAIGAGLDAEMAVSIIFTSLSDDYEPLITALEAWDKDRRTLSAVQAKLIEEWRRRSVPGTSSDSA